MKRIFLISISIFLYYLTGAQVSQGGKPHWTPGHKSASVYVVPELEIKSLLRSSYEEDELLYGKKPLRVGVDYKLNLNPNNAGEWSTLEDGTKIWRFQLYSQNALALNIYFDRYKLNEGTMLFLYDPDMKLVLGGFNNKNNKKSGDLPTAFVPGDKLIIELQVPAGSDYGELNIESITHSIVDITGLYGKKDGYFGDAGYCEVDINCNDGNNWQVEKRAVCRIIFKRSSGATDLCTGTLINTTMNDGRAYVYTANHCIKRFNEAQTAVFYFGYESEECSGEDQDSLITVTHTLSSSDVLATSDSLDFTLLRLSMDVPESYKPYYAGWTIDGNPSQKSVTIHHPGGDVMKISRDLDPALITYQEVNPPPWLSSGSIPGAFWRIEKWEYGVTEGGSSGCPLFNQDKLIVGNLTGGDAYCGYPYNDYFSKFHLNWDYYPDSGMQLKIWLDSINSGVASMEGLDLYMDIPTAHYVRWEIYPNPNNGEFFIHTDSIELRDVKIRVFDSMGRLYGEKNYDSADKIQFKINNLPSGLYFVELKISNFSEVRKVVVLKKAH